MEKSLVRTGAFFAIAFAVAGLYVVVSGFALGKTALEVFTYSGFWLCAMLSLAMYASTRVTRLRYIQPILILALMVANLMTSPDPFASSIFATTAAILFYQVGFFNRRRALKMTAYLAFYYALTVLQVFMRDMGGFLKEETRADRGFGPLIIVTIFLLFLYLSFKERLIVYLKEPKPRLSLSEKGLSSAEHAYSIAIINGRSLKEVAFDFEVSESTVRNTIARAYKKMGVLDKTGFAVLAASWEIVD